MKRDVYLTGMTESPFNSKLTMDGNERQKSSGDHTLLVRVNRGGNRCIWEDNVLSIRRCSDFRQRGQ